MLGACPRTEEKNAGSIVKQYAGGEARAVQASLLVLASRGQDRRQWLTGKGQGYSFPVAGLP